MNIAAFSALITNERLIKCNKDRLVGLVVSMTTDHEVAGSIPSTSTNFKCGLGLERGPPSLMRTIR